MNINQEKVDGAIRKGEILASEALIKMHKLVVKTASLRYQINRVKDELAEETALAKQKKQPSA